MEGLGDLARCRWTCRHAHSRWCLPPKMALPVFSRSVIVGEEFRVYSSRNEGLWFLASCMHVWRQNWHVCCSQYLQIEKEGLDLNMEVVGFRFYNTYALMYT